MGIIPVIIFHGCSGIRIYTAAFFAHHHFIRIRQVVILRNCHINLFQNFCFLFSADRTGPVCFFYKFHNSFYLFIRCLLSIILQNQIRMPGFFHSYLHTCKFFLLSLQVAAVQPFLVTFLKSLHGNFYINLAVRQYIFTIPFPYTVKHGNGTADHIHFLLLKHIAQPGIPHGTFSPVFLRISQIISKYLP